ncbi:hypothetical protein KIPB_001975 [Kipferlia bialata]|uniref:C2H2-type domain-containing protein n=1 Tax=Kipferlia bialata TaxID=797122 RepID=A0A9K3GEL2_9EUKA|nr:hypothetical protein KIPB_001975 [Kipferlia bialata]|eukprot:g1975.t1
MSASQQQAAFSLKAPPAGEVPEGEEGADAEQAKMDKLRKRLEMTGEPEEGGPKRRGPKQVAEEERMVLKARDFEIDFDQHIGRAEALSLASSQQHSGGFRCKVCRLTFKDSASYLDHINSDEHQGALGFQTTVERVSAEKVIARIKYHANRKRKGKTLERKLKQIRADEEATVMKATYSHEREREKRRDMIKYHEAKLRKREEDEAAALAIASRPAPVPPQRPQTLPPMVQPMMPGLVDETVPMVQPMMPQDVYAPQPLMPMAQPTPEDIEREMVGMAQPHVQAQPLMPTGPGVPMGGVPVQPYPVGEGYPQGPQPPQRM